VGVEGGAAEGEEECFCVRKLRNLAVVGDGKLSRTKVKSVTCLANEITNVEVGFAEVRHGGLASGGPGGSSCERKRR